MFSKSRPCPVCPFLPEAHNCVSFLQVVLINAIKDVAKALSDLIGATKGAASKPADDPSMYQLKGAAKVKPYSYILFETICAIALDRHAKLGFQQFLMA